MKLVQKLGLVTTASIDSSKSVKQITSFDKLGRPFLTTTDDASNNVYSKVSAQYDLGGRAYQTSNPYTGASASYWTTTAFDVLGRPTSVTLADNSVTTYSYTANTATVTDPKGIKRKSVADAAGRLSTLWEPDPNNGNSLTLSTSYVYNLLNELTQITQGSQTRTYVYDALGRLNSATTPEAGMVCFGTLSGSTCQSNGYDSFDNLLYRTDARGVVTSYGYDTLNRLTSVFYNVSGATGVPATASLGFTYGNDSSCNSAHGAGCKGQLITMTDGVGSENYTYNSLTQLTQLQKVINGSTYTTSYAHNLAGQLTQLTYPSGRVVQQSVDAVGRLCEVAPSTTGCGTAASPFATALGYSAAGQLTGFRYGNGIYASFGFTADRLQLNCLDYSTTNRGGTCTHDGTTKFGLNYSYYSSPNNNGLVSGITDSVDNGRSASYTYDSLYRLLTATTAGSANYPAWGLSQTYDRYGNRSAQTAIPGAGCVAITCPQPSFGVSSSTNRLIGSPYAYDLSGNMTDDGINTLVYDAENHVTSATNGSSAGAYVYDGNGLRVKRCVPNCTSPTTTTVYFFSGSKVLAEYDNGAAVGSPSREYIYAGAALLARIDSSATKYYHQDQLSNRLVTDSSGNTITQMGTFPFGESWYNASNDKLLFTTYERDSESGNDYAQARYNVSGLGRFSSPDPIAGSTSDPQSLNRYSYVRNMPVMLTDPFGTCPGGLAQNRNPDSSQLQDSKSGGPSNTDPDSAEPQGLGSSIPPGPCAGFTDQGGGGGGGGVSIDRGEAFSRGDGAGGILGTSDSTTPCGEDGCYYVIKHTWTLDGEVVASYGQFMEFEAFADGVQGYYALYGPGALYGSARQAGQAGGAFFFADTEVTHREFGGRLTQDAEGFFSYDLKSVGAVCPPGADCFSGFEPSSDDVAVWHTHVYPQDIVQFLGDRSPMVKTPTDYVTTPIGSGMGTFEVGPWSGGGIRAGGAYGPLPAQIEMIGPPHVAPICRLSGPTFPGISPCN